MKPSRLRQAPVYGLWVLVCALPALVVIDACGNANSSGPDSGVINGNDSGVINSDSGVINGQDRGHMHTDALPERLCQHHDRQRQLRHVRPTCDPGTHCDGTGNCGSPVIRTPPILP